MYEKNCLVLSWLFQLVLQPWRPRYLCIWRYRVVSARMFNSRHRTQLTCRNYPLSDNTVEFDSVLSTITSQRVYCLPCTISRIFAACLLVLVVSWYVLFLDSALLSCTFWRHAILCHHSPTSFKRFPRNYAASGASWRCTNLSCVYTYSFIGAPPISLPLLPCHHFLDNNSATKHRPAPTEVVSSDTP